MLRAEGILFRVGDKTLLEETTLSFEPGKFHVIMGANGAGKSTLLKLLAGDQKASGGRILLEEKELSAYTKKELALKRAVLSQHYHISFPISVEDIVMMGRYPYFSSSPALHDRQVCNQAMELMEVQSFALRDYTTLSGGEAQKVQMSRVLAQIWEEGKGGKYLFLDEPVSHLDIKYQYQLLNAAKDLSRKNNTVIAILHDINLALSFADRLLFMKQGKMRFDIWDMKKVSPELIKEIFDVKASIINPEGHQPVIIF